VIIAGELSESKISALAFQVQARPQPGKRKNVQERKEIESAAFESVHRKLGLLAFLWTIRSYAAVAAFEFNPAFMDFEKIMRPGAGAVVARVVYSRRFGRGRRE